jgi:hypothetical protein
MGLFGTIAIGLRHKKCRRQAKKAVWGMFKVCKDFPPIVLRLLADIHPDPEVFSTYLLASIDAPRMLTEARVEMCRETAGRIFENPEIASLYDWKSADDVPDELILTVAANVSYNFQKEPKWLLHILLLTSWLAECEAGDLYFPKTLTDAFHQPWSAETALELLRDEGDRLGKAQPKRVETKVGRNDPCPCGSKKKYKKCCMDTAPE